MRRHQLLRFLPVCLLLLLPRFGQASTPPVSAGAPCPRYPAGNSLIEPNNLFSSHGVLRVDFVYQQRTDDQGNMLFCFSTPDGAQSPTLHLNPGDELILHLRNDLPAAPAMAMAPASAAGAQAMRASAHPADCSGMTMAGISTNLHFHGTNVPATCHQDGD